MDIAILPLDDDHARDVALRMALSMYLGEACKYCGGVFETLDDLHTAVFAGYHERGRLAHKTCWQANNPVVE
jgi:hypothetical protein